MGGDGAGLYYLPMGIKDFGEPAPTVLGDNEITLPLQGCKGHSRNYSQNLGNRDYLTAKNL